MAETFRISICVAKTCRMELFRERKAALGTAKKFGLREESLLGALPKGLTQQYPERSGGSAAKGRIWRESKVASYDPTLSAQGSKKGDFR